MEDDDGAFCDMLLTLLGDSAVSMDWGTDTYSQQPWSFPNQHPEPVVALPPATAPQIVPMPAQQPIPAIQAPSDPTKKPAGVKKPKKRGLTSYEQVKRMEKQIAEKVAHLEQLSLSNAFLSARVKMLETVIAVRDHQVTRMQSVKAGLTFNPFQKAMGITPEDMRANGPGWMSKRFLKAVDSHAKKLLAVLPQIHKYPFLLWGPDPWSRWPGFHVRVGRGGELAPPLPHPAPGVPPYEGAYHKGLAEELQGTVAAVRAVVDSMDDLLEAYQYRLFLAPESSIVDGINILTAADSDHKEWESLASSVYATQERLGNIGSTPALAPESHWHQVLSRAGLTPAQRLEAAVLWDIFSQAHAGVIAQRKALATAMEKLQQLQGTSPSLLAEGMDSTDSLVRDTAVSGGTALHVAVGTGAGSLGSMSPGTSVGPAAVAWKTAETLQQEATILKSLQQTMIKERCLDSLVAETWRFHILSPVQVSMVFVESYPFYPDVIAMLRIISRDFTAQQGASSSGTSTG